MGTGTALELSPGEELIAVPVAVGRGAKLSCRGGWGQPCPSQHSLESAPGSHPDQLPRQALHFPLQILFVKN